MFNVPRRLEIIAAKLHRLDENIGAAAVALTSDELRDISSAVSAIAVQGARYPENLERLAGRSQKISPQPE